MLCRLVAGFFEGICQIQGCARGAVMPLRLVITVLYNYFDGLEYDFPETKAEKPLQSNLFLPFSPLHDDGREPFFLPSAENRNSSLFHHSTVMAENHSSSLFHHSTVKAENLSPSLFHHSTVKAENLASSLFHHSTVKAENLASSLFHHSTVKAENLGKH
ncbi:hypothetical protein M5K25_022297 [Dendrobium thyrsiflorum]|uniref:Uncharacterized protein n=1 Tax=Dendrobium thyrsiflorum TaxID=117978 RepID=A0ABD0U5U6_DENTH